MAQSGTHSPTKTPHTKTNEQSVLIVHVPYEHRGGEDTHVEALERAYGYLGFKTILFPEVRTSPQKLLSRSVHSLLPGSHLTELDRTWHEFQPKYVHLHNVFPIFGPRLFRWAIERKIPLVMTVHNHRFYCTNGVALRNGAVCKKCLPGKVSWRPVLHNCNGNFKKSVYYAAALTQLRTGDLLSKAVSRFIAPSPYIREELIRFGIDASRITHILNPVNVSPTSASNGMKASDVFYAGRLSPEKGIPTLLSAARRLPAIRFIIAGGGPLEQSVRDAAVTLPNLDYLGHITQNAVLEQIQATRIGVLPSICNEILPSFVLESFFQGKRCVVPALDSTAWLAKGPLPGHLFHPSNSDDLARAINEALASQTVSPEQIGLIRQQLGFERFCTELKAMADSI